jgi:hypothetical protein
MRQRSLARRERKQKREQIAGKSAVRLDLTDEIDLTLIDWFLRLSPSERLQASANWAQLARLRRAEPEND